MGLCWTQKSGESFSHKIAASQHSTNHNDRFPVLRYHTFFRQWTTLMMRFHSHFRSRGDFNRETLSGAHVRRLAAVSSHILQVGVQQCVTFYLHSLRINRQPSLCIQASAATSKHIWSELKVKKEIHSCARAGSSLGLPPFSLTVILVNL